MEILCVKKQLDINRAIRLYRDEKLPTTKVSKMIGCAVQTLILRLRENGIKIRSCGNHMEKCSFETMRHEYEDLQMSTYQIANKHHMSSSAILGRLTRGGVKLRDRTEAIQISHGNIPKSEYLKICSRYKENKHESCGDIAKDYNVHKSTISMILRECGIIPERFGPRIKTYNGGITPLHTRIRHCEKGRIWKRECMARDNYICQISGVRGGRLAVHHLKSFSHIFNEFLALNSDLNPDKDCDILFDLSQQYYPFWDIDNGITLSKEIHRKLHKR